MTTAEKLIQKNKVTFTVDGLEYVCRRWCFALAVEAYGAAALGLVKDGEPGKRVNMKDVDDRREVVRKALAVAMLEPRLGDDDDAEANVVTMTTMADAAYSLFSKLVGGDMEKAENFPESSEGLKE